MKCGPIKLEKDDGTFLDKMVLIISIICQTYVSRLTLLI